MALRKVGSGRHLQSQAGEPSRCCQTGTELSVPQDLSLCPLISARLCHRWRACYSVLLIQRELVTAIAQGEDQRSALHPCSLDSLVLGATI